MSLPYNRLLKPLLGLAVGLGFAGAVQAQSAIVPRVGTVTVKLMPLALADPTTPTFRFGAEYRLSPLWGVEASYGLQMRNLGWGANGGAPLNDRYQKLHAEARHYVGGSPFYLAAAGFRVQQQYDRGAGTLYDGSQLMMYSSARVHRAITGGLLKAGVVIPLDAHWRLDVAAGAGIRYGQIRYETRELSPHTSPYGCYMDYQTECGFGLDVAPTTDPGTFRRATLAFDIRLGYQIGR